MHRMHDDAGRLQSRNQAVELDARQRLGVLCERGIATLEAIAGLGLRVPGKPCRPNHQDGARRLGARTIHGSIVAMLERRDL